MDEYQLSLCRSKKHTDNHVKAKDAAIKAKVEAQIKLNKVVQVRTELVVELQKVKDA